VEEIFYLKEKRTEFEGKYMGGCGTNFFFFIEFL
jgi:hypothetical protein